MKTLTKKQEDHIKSIELEGDELFEKETFESCLSALDKYVTAQDELRNAANDCGTDVPYPHFSSSNVSYNAWYASLVSKISKATSAMSDPKRAKK